MKAGSAGEHRVVLSRRIAASAELLRACRDENPTLARHVLTRKGARPSSLGK
jgi:hypothetical protein